MIASWMAGLLLARTALQPKQVGVASEDAERSVTIGVGVAFELEPRAFKSGAATFIEYEAIPEALEVEVEVGGQSVWGHAGRELSAALIFKWPRRLAPQLEVMIGAGPTIVASGETSWGLEGAVDVMWWPSQRVGVSLEPVYDVLFGTGRSNSFGVTPDRSLVGDRRAGIGPKGNADRLGP